MIDLDEPVVEQRPERLRIVAWKPLIFDVAVPVSHELSGFTEVRGYRSPSGLFGVHKVTGYPVAFPWAVTHLPSGRRLPGRFSSQAGAVMWVESLERLHVDWYDQVPTSRNGNPVTEQIKQAALYGPAFIHAHGVPAAWGQLGDGPDPHPPESWADGSSPLSSAQEVGP